MPDSSALYYYGAIFAMLVGAGFGLPIPEELPVVIAGAAVGHADEAKQQVTPEALAAAVAMFAHDPNLPYPAGVPWDAHIRRSGEIKLTLSSPLPNSLRWWIMLPICIVGVVLSDTILYGVGRYFGPKLLEKRWLKRMLPPPKRQRIEGNFHKYGIWVLLFARFLPAIRSPIFVMAGVMRLSFVRFLLADGLYAIPGVSLLFYLAFQFGDKFRRLVEEAENKVDRLRPLIILLAITAVASYLVYHFMRYPVSEGDPHELPLIGEQMASKIEIHIPKEDGKRPSDATSSDGAGKQPIGEKKESSG